jgi:nucleotide-binding universal stress UspA family protein
MNPQLREPVLPRARRFRMVVGVDLSEYADMVIEHALDQAARHVAPDLHFLVVKESRKDASEALQQRLADRVVPMLETFNQHGTNWRARLHVRAGSPDEQIAGLAADVRADLIVIGSFGLHHGGHSLKTVPSRVLRDAPCATLVVTMPLPLDTSPHCPACDLAREDSEGEQLFCAKHSGDRVSTGDYDGPITTWTGGSLMW